MSNLSRGSRCCSDSWNNIAVGNAALYANTVGSQNTAVGESALQFNTSGSNNTAVGFVALGANTTGNWNTAVGIDALLDNTTGGSNTAVGHAALNDNLNGGQNSAFGEAALFSNTTGSQDTALGWNALFSNTTANGNTAVGYQTLASATTGGNNSALGLQALFNNTTGASNVAVGKQAGQKNTTGSSNTAVGTAAFNFATSSSNNTAVGDAAMQGTNSSLTLSGSNDTAVGVTALGKYIDGSNNTAVGFQAMLNATTSSSSVAVGINAGEGKSTNDAYTGLTAIGFDSGQNLQNGSNFNTLIGYQAGFNITTGADNILIGSATSSSANANLTTGSQNILIGENEQLPIATGSGQLDIGNLIYGTGLGSTGSTVSGGNIGIANTTPYARLSVKGPDNASSTLAFNVVNSASTTVLAVFDGGNAQLSGTLTQSSDQRLKTNIQSLDASTSLSLIDELNPVTFNWINPDEDSTPQIGFIAQQVQQVFPNLVSTTSATALTPNGTLGLNYIGLVAPIVSAIQEIGNVSGAFERSLIAWLGDASNGIQDLFAGTVHAHQFCGEKSDGSEVCLTGDQIAALLAANNQSPTAAETSQPASTTQPLPVNTAPVIQINGNNPSVVQVGDTYSDLGATITGPQADLDLDIQTFLNGTKVPSITIDTAEPATDTIDYVVTDESGNITTSTRTVIVEAAQVPSTDATSTATSTTE